MLVARKLLKINELQTRKRYSKAFKLNPVPLLRASQKLVHS